MTPPEFLCLDSKLTEDRFTCEEQVLIHAHGGLIEMGSSKWPQQATFILLDKETVFGSNWQDKKIWVVGTQLVNSQNRVRASGSKLKK